MIKVTLERQGKNVDFSIDTSFRTVILGENGIGKSTILKSIAEKSATENWLSVEVPSKLKLAYFSQIEKTDLLISGGEHTKQRLEKLFSTKADLYILDEPTNNLDQKNIDWLKQCLKQENIKIIFTSHNVDFIDEIAEVVFYMDSKGVEKTQQKCSQYLKDRKQRIEKEFADYELNKRTHKRLLDSARLAQVEFEAGVKWENEDKGLQGFKREMAGKFGGATVKRLSKRAEQYDIKEPENDPIPRVKLQSGDKLSRMFDFQTLSISSGDKIAICGKNGVGKTTLVEKLINDIKDKSIKYFYLSQNWYEKIEDKNVLEYLATIFSEKEEAYKALAYNHLDVGILNKKFKDLSPGVRIKVLLGVLSRHKYDLIVWDEPTNHLDVMTQYILHQALLDYTGALIIVTHDSNLLRDESFTKIKL